MRDARRFSHRRIVPCPCGPGGGAPKPRRRSRVSASVKHIASILLAAAVAACGARTTVAPSPEEPSDGVAGFRPAELQKMDAALVEWLDGFTDGPDTSAYLPVVVRFGRIPDDADLVRLGLGRLGNLVLGRLTSDQLHVLLARPDVLRIELAAGRSALRDPASGDGVPPAQIAGCPGGPAFFEVNCMPEPVRAGETSARLEECRRIHAEAERLRALGCDVEVSASY